MNEPDIDAFIARWGGGMSRGGNERANLQLFLTEFCTLLDLPQPDPASADNSQNVYFFERSVTEHQADGTTTPCALDLYRRGCFVLEGKDTGKQTGSGSCHAAIVKDTPAPESSTAKASTGKIKFPSQRAGMHAQIAAVKDALGQQALSLDELAETFTESNKNRPKIADILATLESLGFLQREGERYRLNG